MTVVAMVLAAGRGERMRPLSRVLPKPALPLLRQPVVASAIALAATADCRRIVVNTWHLAEIMERSLGDIETTTHLAVSREPELMGTAGGLALARDRGLLGDDGPILVINGDGVLNLDLKPLFSRMEDSRDLVSLALLPHLDPRAWSRVVLEDDGSVASIMGAGDPVPGEVPFLYPGVMLVSREALSRLEAQPGGVPEHLWGPALALGRFGGIPVSGHWREVGTPPGYLEAVMTRLNGDTVIHPSAEIHESAAIGSALIGRGVRIEADAVVGASVVAEGARVAAGARVLRSVLLGKAVATAGENVIDDFRAEPA